MVYFDDKNALFEDDVAGESVVEHCCLKFENIRRIAAQLDDLPSHL